MTRRGPKKPAREMTTEEAAERLFGKRVIRKVQQELEEPKLPEKPAKSLIVPSTKEEGK